VECIDEERSDDIDAQLPGRNATQVPEPRCQNGIPS